MTEAITGRHRAKQRSGAVLLEAIVAVALFAAAGLSILAATSQAADAVRQARETDGQFREASAFLDAVALWPRSDLNRHLGVQREGRWILTVDRPAPTLYIVILSLFPVDRSREPGRELLRTILFRPNVSDDSPD